MIKILVVDDSALMRKLLGQIFGAEADCEVRFARNGVEALDLMAGYKPDVVTLDVHMPQMDGIACLDRIMVEQPCPVVMVSSLTAAGAEATLAALRLGAVDFIAKPDGAISLSIQDMAAELVAKVRSAAGAKLRTTLRLQDRVRHRIGPMTVARRPAALAKTPAGTPMASDGLVLIGTSTGGPPALEAVLTDLPADFPWPIVIAQHMPASFTGPLARRLNGICAITVTEVTQPTPLQAGCAYIGRGEADIIISRRSGGLIAMAAPMQADYPWHPSTDRLVTTAMDAIPARQLIGVLMTGMGNDGAKAMAQLHRDGGRTIAEAEETAIIWGMPGELVRADGADWVLPLQAIASRLCKLTASA